MPLLRQVYTCYFGPDCKAIQGSHGMMPEPTIVMKSARSPLQCVLDRAARESIPPLKRNRRGENPSDFVEELFFSFPDWDIYGSVGCQWPPPVAPVGYLPSWRERGPAGGSEAKAESRPRAPSPAFLAKVAFVSFPSTSYTRKASSRSCGYLGKERERGIKLANF
jgi:hypothetical protein